jgi:hypothetical protein
MPTDHLPSWREPMAIWPCCSGPQAAPDRSLQLVVHHTDGEREYAYDRDPVLGSGTEQILAAAADHKWTVIDMAADWSAVHPPGA